MHDRAGSIDAPDSLLFGERADGSLVHISEVLSGLACHCRCPNCKARLIARKGEQVGHHFGHQGAAGKPACRGGPETALHRFAKELLASRLTLSLPPLPSNGATPPRYDGGAYRFDSADLEHRLGSIIADVIVRRADRELLVEFCVTHRCDPGKVARIAALNLAAVEIDLSELPRSTSRRELEEAILDHAPRRWLHNPKLGHIPSPSVGMSSEPAPQPDRTAAVLAGVYTADCREVQSMRARGLAAQRLVADGLSDTIGIPVPGLGCFIVPPSDWQGAIFMAAIEQALARGSAVMTVKAALWQLRDRGWLHPRFSRLTTAEVAALSAAEPLFAPPDAAIAAWAMELSRQGLLVPNGSRDRWIIRREVVQAVRKARQHRVATIEPAV